MDRPHRHVFRAFGSADQVGMSAVEGGNELVAIGVLGPGLITGASDVSAVRKRRANLWPKRRREVRGARKE
jgi:hypothetical protein